jgi:chemotaxis protein histidine kinase CheA
MDVGRFLDLYVSETQDHVRLLQRSLLSVESDTDGVALGEAFRAAHTLKSLSAAMGFDGVARLAHELEDRLDGIRARSGPADGETVDDLLAGADAIDRAIAPPWRTGSGVIHHGRSRTSDADASGGIAPGRAGHPAGGRCRRAGPYTARRPHEGRAGGAHHAGFGSASRHPGRGAGRLR